MCGIFGVLSTKDRLSLDQERFIQTATVIDQVRGEDGTGILAVAKDGKHVVHKRAVAGCDFYYSRQGIAAKRDIGLAKCVIGHNRKTTVGGHAHESCHPFEYEHLTGVHNGTIPWAALERLDTKDTVAQVDSAKLYAAMNKAKSPVDVLSQVHVGGYALAWVNHTDNTLNFARNSERPLWLANGEDGLYWASEPGMLYWLMSRYGLEADDSQMYEFETETLYSMDMESFEFVKTPYEVHAPKYKRPTYGTGARSGATGNTDSRGWLQNLSSPFKTYKSILHLKSEIPSLREMCDVVEENIDFCGTSSDQHGMNAYDDYIDVVIVDKANNNIQGAMFPDYLGYLYDETESGIIVPVKLASVPEKKYELGKLLAEGKKGKKRSLPTLRAEVTGYRVHATGRMFVTASPVLLWDSDANAEWDSAASEAIKEVNETQHAFNDTYTTEQIRKYWKSLSEPVEEIKE